MNSPRASRARRSASTWAHSGSGLFRSGITLPVCGLRVCRLPGSRPGYGADWPGQPRREGYWTAQATPARRALVIARRLRWPPDARQMERQLGGAWLCGSVVMGTVAWGFLSAEGTAPVPVPANLSASAGTAICPGWPPPCGPPSFFELMPLTRLAVLALVALLFVALALLGRWTAGASWLTGDARARLLWVLLVGGGGLIGWSYAAVITFAAGFGSTAQLILAYLGGGLPFALVAGMLLRPWRRRSARTRRRSTGRAAQARRTAARPAPGPPAWSAA